MTSAAQSHPVRPRPGATALRLSHPTSSALLFAFAALQAIGAAGCTYQVIQLIPHRLRHGMALADVTWSGITGVGGGASALRSRGVSLLSLRYQAKLGPQPAAHNADKRK